MSLIRKLESKGNVFPLAMLIALVTGVFWQTSGFDFINLDDDQYVYSNAPVAAGLAWNSVVWAFTEFHSANWHPLTWISHMADVQVFGMKPGGHHATNFVLHALNSFLAFVALNRLTGSFWRSLAVAALFAIHPAHVESVAWISERKDVLSAFFWLVTIVAYTSYSKSEGAKNDEFAAFLKTGRYWLVVILFTCGLMSKPMVVTLPFVLLLLDFWPLGRIGSARGALRAMIEKTPLFVLSAVSAYITLLAQKSAGATDAMEFLSFGTRVLNAVASFFGYIVMLFVPRNLALAYPYNSNIGLTDVAVPMIVLIAISGLCIHQYKSRRYMLIGWLWYLGTLVPVIGLIQVGIQSMADRYTYIPYFGLFIMLVWGGADIAVRYGGERFAGAAITAAVAVFSIVSFQQTSRWRDSETIFKHTLSVTSGNSLIAHNLCLHFLAANRLTEAERYCTDAIAANSTNALAFNSLGIIGMQQRRYAFAGENFEKAVAISPDSVPYQVNLASSYAFAGRAEEAERVLLDAMSLSAAAQNSGLFFDGFRLIAATYAEMKDFPKALENMKRVVSIAPQRPDSRAYLALVLAEMRDFTESNRQIEGALAAAPNDPRILTIYGRILLMQNRNTEAVGLFEQALKVQPNFEEARTYLKQAREKQ